MARTLTRSFVDCIGSNTVAWNRNTRCWKVQAIRSCCPPESKALLKANVAIAGQHVAKAFNDAKSEDLRVHLVQGPPGTGKTHLIRGIVSCWLHANGATANVGSADTRVFEETTELAETTKWTKKDRKQTRKDDDGVGGGGAPPARRVLICAQSNAGMVLFGTLSVTFQSPACLLSCSVCAWRTTMLCLILAVRYCKHDALPPRGALLG